VRIEFPPALFTRDLAAYYLQMSLTDVDLLRGKGELIAVGEGKRVRFRKEDLDRYIERLPERGA
jgi:excisionase family DNA binding protein